MRSPEKVKINLNSARESANPPLKYTKERNGRPDSKNFRFVPKLFPQLKHYVKRVAWDSSRKEVCIQIGETAQFEVVKWMNWVDRQHHEIEKSPFVDIDSNHAILTFMDDVGAEVATIKFKNLKVENHTCRLHSGDAKNMPVFVQHHIVLSYQEAELDVVADRDDSAFVNLNEHKDDEWQTVELPR